MMLMPSSTLRSTVPARPYSSVEKTKHAEAESVKMVSVVRYHRGWFSPASTNFLSSSSQSGRMLGSPESSSASRSPSSKPRSSPKPRHGPAPPPPSSMLAPLPFSSAPTARRAAAKRRGGRTPRSGGGSGHAADRLEACSAQPQANADAARPCLPMPPEPPSTTAGRPPTAGSLGGAASATAPVRPACGADGSEAIAILPEPIPLRNIGDARRTNQWRATG
mmetsp:Transcript_139062/g.444103  ORF Transcript_139062/g.444103 Transcript_139062/m.444103 type:complete len:221 (-) Transcript_139062:48-710(-)